MWNRAKVLCRVLMPWSLLEACSCPPAVNSTVPSAGRYAHVAAVARGKAYVLAQDHLAVWDLKRPVYALLPPDGVVAVTPDGAIAIAASPTTCNPERCIQLLEAWDTHAGLALQSTLFEGRADVLGITSSKVLVNVEKSTPFPASNLATQLPPPMLPPSVSTHKTWWSFKSGEFEEPWNGSGCTGLSISNDGVRMACESSIFDSSMHQTFQSPPIAPEWIPRAKEPWCEKCPLPLPPYIILSRRLVADGSVLYFTYRGHSERQEWRLERWRPSPDEAQTSQLERLATSNTDLNARIVALSHGGKIVVTRGQTPTVRRSPHWAPETLPIDSLTSAAFAEDDALLVTGHQDGRLCAWDTNSLRLLASSQPQ